MIASAKRYPGLGARACLLCGDVVLAMRLPRPPRQRPRREPGSARPLVLIGAREMRYADHQRRALPVVDPGADPRPSDLVSQRPRTRGDCAGGERPCPWVSCRHHLYLDADVDGTVKVNFPDHEPWDIPETCALDVAERDGATLDEVGKVINVTRERVRQIERASFSRVAGHKPLREHR